MSTVLDRYQELVASGQLRPDDDQRATVMRLHRLSAELDNLPVKGSIVWRVIRKPPPSPRGIYMWGGVGRGKSMLMDFFY